MRKIIALISLHFCFAAVFSQSYADSAARISGGSIYDYFNCAIDSYGENSCDSRQMNVGFRIARSARPL